MLLIPLWYAVILAVIFGSCLGSFYNVIIYRMPRGLSLWKPPSFCPRCKKRIPIYYNLPVIGWLWLRGKSACCKEPISIQYPLVEALCGVLGGAAFLLANYPWDWGGEVAWP
ncbi:MAG: prepilin peptidase, partial [Fibrobacteraceae bacterium]